MADISGDAEMSDISQIQIVSEVSVSCSVAIERTKQKRGRLIPRDVYGSLHLYIYYIYVIFHLTFDSAIPFVL